MKIKTKLLPTGLLLVWLFPACDPNRIFDDNTAIENRIWNVNKPVVYEVSIDDTLSPCNFYLNVRHAEAYPYSNLFVFLKTQFPNGELARDTVEVILQDKNGKWLGSGLGDIFDNQILFKRGLRFPLKGKYVFTIEQAMRTPDLPMIMEIGLRIEQREVK